MEHRELGASAIGVSRLALGSWRTFERMPREQGAAVMAAAREAGIDFLDDARYDDETGTAPLPTGYSEVVFGELFRASGWKRDEVIVANKLWWEFWPEQSAAEELDGSLGRMGFDYVDLIYAERLPKALSVEEAMRAVAELVDAGKARVWGVLNWSPEAIEKAARIARSEGLPLPCAAQLPYSVVSREPVEDDAMGEALDAASASVVASAVLAGGALTGKYAGSSSVGRLSHRLGDDRLQEAFLAGGRLAELARGYGTTPAKLAIAFALSGQRVASVLFGATSPEQVRENVEGLALADHLAGMDLAAVRALAS